ncbi:Protein CBG27659 [Caenorhabditis briggsae]|uniref:Protein CBG27659 n=2 Tax=Caenorhabditis briggsae TaxID=6238 RepID=B6IJA4_CAEBR|nr:Protein CBG27659 [Caenorhabditis briggsae]ULT81935.1 hypothetical protein L3Y34_011712 [Caenorhabditis briggsae]CAR99938.1 Protein CBG27659 [Caenorhabditis briggsae]
MTRPKKKNLQKSVPTNPGRIMLLEEVSKFSLCEKFATSMCSYIGKQLVTEVCGGIDLRLKIQLLSNQFCSLVLHRVNSDEKFSLLLMAHRKLPENKFFLNSSKINGIHAIYQISVDGSNGKISAYLKDEEDLKNAMKYMISHMTRVFTKNVCIDISNVSNNFEKKVMKMVRSKKLDVHCYGNYQEKQVAFTKIQEFSAYPRVVIKNPIISSDQLKSFFDEWKIGVINREYVRFENMDDVDLDSMLVGLEVFNPLKVMFVEQAMVKRESGEMALVEYNKISKEVRLMGYPITVPLGCVGDFGV